MKYINLQPFGKDHNDVRRYKSKKYIGYVFYRRINNKLWDIIKKNHKVLSNDFSVYECVILLGTFSTIRECKQYIKQLKESN
tara:strand:+ start:525 stop:770 length:246 start_codon:yes stop_codon:yes gene_type:complete